MEQKRQGFFFVYIGGIALVIPIQYFIEAFPEYGGQAPLGR